MKQNPRNRFLILKVLRSAERRTLLGILIILGTTCFVFGQDGRGLLDDIPSAKRARLLERLDLFVEYERTKQWDKFYDLLYLPRVAEEERAKARSAYLAVHNDPNDPVNILRIAFIPRIISAAPEIQDGTYMVRGCATYNIYGNIKKQNDIIMAHLVNDDWYFSAFGEVAPGDDLCAP